MLLARIGLASVLFASASALAGGVEVKMRNVEGQEVLNRILTDDAYWADGWVHSYEGKPYNEIRLKQLPSGYVPMIVGEGVEDYPHEVVADIVYERNVDLPKYMSGAKAMVYMGGGYDPVVKADYRDTFYVLDLTVFYGSFPQRMYRRHDDATNTTVLWFEKMDPSWVSPQTWSKYEAVMERTLDNMDKRWPPFNAVVEVTDVYGMFVVEPGTVHTSRVSFVSKLYFGDEAGWVAKWGSQLPSVLKAGLKSGFGASVALAADETKRRAAHPKPQPAPEPEPAPAAPADQ